MQQQKESFFQPKKILFSSPNVLILTQLINEKDDPSYYSRTLAYFNKNFITKASSLSFPLTTAISFSQYINNYIDVYLNDLQRNKYNIMAEMVQLLNSWYEQQDQTIKKDLDVCDNLLEIVDFCMCTSEERCEWMRVNYVSSPNLQARRPTGEHINSPLNAIASYWKKLLLKHHILPELQLQYLKLLKSLLMVVHQAFLCNDKLLELKNKYNEIIFDNFRKKNPNQAKNFYPDLCISWYYFEVLADLKEINAKDPCFVKFKNIYVGRYYGLANEVFLITDFWDFLLKERADIAQRGSKNRHPYNLFKIINKLLSDHFPNCKPIQGSKNFLNLGK